MDSNFLSEIRKRKDGKYKRIAEAFENGFEGDAEKCRAEFLPDSSIIVWYSTAARIGKQLRRKGISFGLVRQPNAAGIYRVIQTTDDANINTTTSLKSLRNKAKISMKQLIVNVTNFPEIAQDLLPLLFPLQQSIGEAGNKLLEQQNKNQREAIKELKAFNGNS